MAYFNRPSVASYPEYCRNLFPGFLGSIAISLAFLSAVSLTGFLSLVPRWGWLFLIFPVCFAVLLARLSSPKERRQTLMTFFVGLGAFVLFVLGAKLFGGAWAGFKAGVIGAIMCMVQLGVAYKRIRS